MKFLRRFLHATLLRQPAEKETTDSADLRVTTSACHPRAQRGPGLRDSREHVM